MNLENQTFGEWIAIYPLKKNKTIYWHCKCSCGIEKDVSQASLRNGRSKSCGHNKNKGKFFVDITG